MSSILVVEQDPVFGAVLEDRLQVAGHDVVWLRDGEDLVRRCEEAAPDLLVLELASPADAALDTVLSLRSGPETGSLPVLALAESNESADRVAALRAGVDDYLSKPCDLEELVLRAVRLVGSRTVSGQMLHGDLESQPIWELVQYLQAAKKSGDLVVRTDTPLGTVTGRLHLDDGKIYGARWEHLRGRQALLAVFGLKAGRFRLVPDPTDTIDIVTDGVGGGSTEPLPANEILMEAAWIEDELEKLRDNLPVSGTPLHATDIAPPAEEEGSPVAEIPYEEIRERVRCEPGLRLYDLVNTGNLAPQVARLAVAWMSRHGLLELAAGAAFPNTTEIDAHQLVEMSITELLAMARAAGFGTTAMPILILVEPGNRARLLELVESVPGYRRNETLHGFAEKLREDGGGSVAFPSELGKLVLHARTLSAEDQEEIGAVATVAAGVCLWLDDGAEREAAAQVIERLDQVKTNAVGVLVADQTAARPLLSELTADTQRWRTSVHPPQSLLGIFRLLEPETP